MDIENYKIGQLLVTRLNLKPEVVNIEAEDAKGESEVS